MGYQQLLSILKEGRQQVADEKREPLVACPRCGEPLQTNPRGVKSCPFDGFKAPPGATKGECA